MIARTAWAKVNLYLQVTGRRSDGYHELDSLVVFAAVGDGIEVLPAAGLSLTVAGPRADEVPAGPENLVLRAAVALREAAFGCDVATTSDRGAAIRLHKVLPAAAGLGGGSADAAAVLDSLVRLWSLDALDLPLDRIAVQLGADVPICRYGRPAFVSGLGEVIHRAPPLPPAWLLLVNPGVPLATPAVFRARSGPFSAPSPWNVPGNVPGSAPGNVPGSAPGSAPESAPESAITQWRDERTTEGNDGAPVTAVELAERLAARRNDLEAPACALAPVVAQVIERLGETEGCLLSRMSGSGATCFGLYASGAEARAARERISAAQPGWWIADAQILHGPLDRHWEVAP